MSWCTLNQYERIYTVIKMLKEYRQNKGYTQEQTAEMIGISARQYQRIEKDEDHIRDYKKSNIRIRDTR